MYKELSPKMINLFIPKGHKKKWREEIDIIMEREYDDRTNS